MNVDSSFKAPEILGRPTNNSIIVNILPSINMDVYVEYGNMPGVYANKTKTIAVQSLTAIEILIDNLISNTRYYYRLRYTDNTGIFVEGIENSFVTQRAPGSIFSFGIQGDSHPERAPLQFNSDLYTVTMNNIKAYNPDFYMTIGDDFSSDKLNPVTKDTVENLYLNQRQFLGQVGKNSPLFLVNGNHENAAKYLLDGTPNNVAVWEQNARNKYFSQPAPDNFYTGDLSQVDFIGYLRDYYAWSWGDALFVIIDPYWHSSVPVDTVFSGGEKRVSLWDISLDDTQYKWFKKTLETSTAKYKFIFTHHILGTGRGGIEMASQYEWGGRNRKGTWEFNVKRPTWELPIHQLMAKNGVTIFFQGHDHIFVRQELDGVVYLSLPEPADPNYTLYNADAYTSDAKYGNTGHVKITVSPDNVKIEYILSFLPKDEINGRVNGQVAYSYIVTV